MAYQKLQKGFDYILAIDTMPLFYVQEVEFPTVGVEEVEHGGYGTVQKTAGRQTTGDLVIKTLMSADLLPHNFLHEYGLMPARASQPLNALGGITQFAGTVAGFPITILDDVALKSRVWPKLSLIYHDGATPGIVRQWDLKGCFVKEYNLENTSRTSSENLVQSITFAVNAVVRVK